MSTDKLVDSILDRILSSNSIFTNKNVLRNDYIPDKILFRDKQISKLIQIIAPILKNVKPSNVFLYGKTGTGKTVVARYVMKKLQEKANEIGVKSSFLYVNTRFSSTPYRVLVDIGSQLGVQIPFTGLSISEALNRIFQKIIRDELNVVLVLDEIDYLVKNFDNNLLYEFTRSNTFLTDQIILTIVGISNDLKFKDYLDPRVLSSLSEEEIVFPPYTVEELEAILWERVKLAFKPGSISDSTIKLCASLAAAEHGDARRAVDLLRVAGELAEREGSPQVLPEHVKEAVKNIESDRVYEIVKSLPLHSKLILTVILSSNQELTTGQLYSQYSRICENVGLTPLTQRRISSLISELDVLGIVNAPVISSGRFGRSKKIKLVVPRESIIRALKEDELLSFMFS